jgi:AcrR family transcriptional regulator
VSERASTQRHIDPERARQRERTRHAILDAAWQVAESDGWHAFSLERVAARADLGRSTLVTYFAGLEQLLIELAERALLELSTRLSSAPTLPAALDAPVRFASQQPAAFSLLFPAAADARSARSCVRLLELRQEARVKLGRLERLARRAGTTLPEDAASAATFLQGISLAGAVVSALRDDTTLRHRWQTFCLLG